MRLLLKISIPIAIACATVPVSAQTLFEDAKGETNMFISGSPFGWARLNTSDNSASFGYNRVRLAGFDNAGKMTSAFYGGDVKVTVKDGLGNLISKKKFSTGVSFNGNLGLQHLTKTGNILAAYIRGELAYSQYTYLDTVAVNYKDLKKWEPSVLLHVNYQINLADSASGRESYIFIGGSIGYKKSNNSSELDDGEMQVLIDSSGANSIITSKAGKIGDFVGYNAMPLNFDIAWLPQVFEKNLIGINSYFRTSFFKTKNTADIGIGLFVAQDGRPRNILGGLAWQFNDISNKLDKPDNLLQRSSVFAYVGFTIGK